MMMSVSKRQASIMVALEQGNLISARYAKSNNWHCQMELYVLFFQVFCIYEVTFCLKYGMSSEMLLYVKVRL
jgi:hypothetical protein